MPKNDLSEGRKVLYYLGMALMGLGFVLFVSLFFAINQGPSFPGPGSSGGMGEGRAFGGIFLIAIGAFLRRLGVRGLAGSGVILDPERARKDVEPWSRMAGGMVKDALDETGLGKGEKSEVEQEDFEEKLRKLHRLREEGIISEEEYEREKAEILDEL